jgi:HEAT repeat protein
LVRGNSTHLDYNAAYALSFVDPLPDGIVQELSSLLRDGDKYRSRNAAVALSFMGADGTYVLEEALFDGEQRVRFRAILQLTFRESQRTFRDETVPRLVSLLESKDKSERDMVLNLLTRMGSRAKPAVPKLLPQLDGPNSNRVWIAIHFIDSDALPKAEDAPAPTRFKNISF